MKLNLLLVFLFSFGFITGVNSQWTIKHLDESDSYSDNIIKFKNDSLGLFMGDNSLILKSKDIGETWNKIPIQTLINFKDLQFVSDSIVYAVGDNYTGSSQNFAGILIRSVDNGDTWESINSFNNKQLYSIWFFNNDSGMVAGSGGIFRTTDSGSSWDTVWSITQFGYKYGFLEQLNFPTAKTGYAIGEGRTQNTTSGLFDYFLLRTRNSGLTWDTIKTFQHALTSIQFLNIDTGFIGTSSGIILKTINGGITWTDTQVADRLNSIRSLHFISDLIGYAAGAPNAYIPEASTSFFISKTNNCGETWESYDTLGIPLNSIFFINDTTGFVSGSYDLIMKSRGMISGLPENYPWQLVLNIDDYQMPGTHIKIYPNPTDGKIWIQQTNGTRPLETIKLIDVSGRIIDIPKPVAENELMQIDISDLAPGMYLIRVSYSGGNEILKVLKK